MKISPTLRSNGPREHLIWQFDHVIDVAPGRARAYKNRHQVAKVKQRAVGSR